MTKRNKKTLVIILVLALMLALVIIFIILPLCKKTKAPVKMDTVQQATNKDDQSHFEEGLTFFNEGKYEQAILSFSQAIILNPKKPDYFMKKSEAEFNIGKKNDAISTIEAGLEKNPGDGSLNSRLDTLKKGPLGNDFDL